MSLYMFQFTRRSDNASAMAIGNDFLQAAQAIFPDITLEDLHREEQCSIGHREVARIDEKVVTIDQVANLCPTLVPCLNVVVRFAFESGMHLARSKVRQKLGIDF